MPRFDNDIEEISGRIRVSLGEIETLAERWLEQRDQFKRDLEDIRKFLKLEQAENQALKAQLREQRQLPCTIEPPNA